MKIHRCMKVLGLLMPVFFLMAAFSVPAGRPAAQPGQKNLVLIIDASGSMWGQVEGVAKIAIAKEVLIRLLHDLPPGVNVGLVAYGHRRKGDCGDVEELAALGALNRNALMEKINSLNPKGKTPITFSVQMTAEKLKAMEEETTIILVSDGKEPCGGDPCALVRELRQAGVRFIMHVIGFDVSDEEKQQLECMADAGGGMYYSANNAGEFQMAASKVVSEAQPFGFLEVTATKRGAPFRAHVWIHPEGGKNYLVRKDTGKEGPAVFQLLPGVYDVRVEDFSLPDKPTVRLKSVVVESGKTETIDVAF